MEANPITFFFKLEKTIYSKGLKLAVAVPTFSAEILICHLLVHHIDVAIATIKFHVDLA